METLPTTVSALIASLDETIPERCPDPSEDDREIWMYAGKRELVRMLKHRLEDGKSHSPDTEIL